MLLNGNPNSNGANGHTLVGDSDYPRVDFEPFTIDVVAKELRPGWHDDQAAFTLNAKWLADPFELSLTFRSDSLTDILRDMGELRRLVEKSREQRSEAKPDVPQDEPMAKACEVHGGAMMKRRQSKAGGHFYSHRIADGSWCNGK